MTKTARVEVFVTTVLGKTLNCPPHVNQLKYRIITPTANRKGAPSARI